MKVLNRSTLLYNFRGHFWLRNMIFNSLNISIARISQGAKRSGFKFGTKLYHIIDNVYNKLEGGTFSAFRDMRPNVNVHFCPKKGFVLLQYFSIEIHASRNLRFYKTSFYHFTRHHFIRVILLNKILPDPFQPELNLKTI